MKKYIHVKKGLNTAGDVIDVSEVKNYISNTDGKDYYTSAYYYDQDLKDLFDNTGSVRGYTGAGYTESLHWDIDSSDLNIAKEDSIKLFNKLKELGFYNGIDIFFSGNKGFHIYLKTNTTFNHKQTADLCQKIAFQAKAKIDPVVYNVTRAFRAINTKHQTSNLYKVQLHPDDLLEWSIDEIKEYAQKPHEIEILNAEDASFLIEKFNISTAKIEPKQTSATIHYIDDYNTDFIDMSKCPKYMRRCIYRLENGLFGPGERENGLIRIAAHYKGEGKDREFTFTILDQALRKREKIYPNAKPFNHTDTNRILDQVFSEHWNGGTFSCSDPFLQQHCDSPNECFKNKQDSKDSKVKKRRSIMSINDLCTYYVEEQKHAPESYPTFGIPWLDSRVFIRPKDYSVLNGSNASGKTSLVVEIIENLNRLKMYHIMFSMDMSDLAMFLKLAARYTSYTIKEVEEFFNPNSDCYSEPVMAEIINKLQKKLPYTLFDFSASLNVDELCEIVLDVEKSLNEKIHMAFVDYAGRLIGASESSYVNATRNATMFNDIAKETNAHWMVLSQISREHGDHTESLYSSRVSKESGAWEENATFTLNVWRPLSKIEYRETAGSAYDMGYHIFIGKNRKGTPYEEVSLLWNGKTGKIRPMERVEEQEYAEGFYKIFGKLPPLQILNKTSEAQSVIEAAEADMDDPNESDAAYAKRTSSQSQKKRLLAKKKRFGNY